MQKSKPNNSPHVKVVEDLIAAYPRRRLIKTVSPVQRLERLEAALDSPVRIYMKRDDLLQSILRQQTALSGICLRRL